MPISSKNLPDVSQAGVTANLPQPPFPHLLRSNTPPTESEISLLREVITIAEEEESRLKEIANHTESDHLTPKTLKDLTRELGHTHQFIIEHNATLSSIRHIPPEILQNIFIHTLPTTATPGSRVLHPSQLPWALSQVCQLWRRTMLSFSDMWRDLPIVELEDAHTKEKPYFDLLTELLKRSHNMPIRLTIARGSNEDIAHPAIDILVLHSHRWQEIKIEGTFGILSALKKIKGRLSSLQSLYLHLDFFSSAISDPVNYPVRDLFQIAPQLRHVDFRGPPSTFLFPTHQLVHYSQDGAYFEQAIQVMVSSPSLRNLHFYHQQTISTILPMVALSLPDLTVLDAHFDAFSTIYEPFLDNITTPALEELTVVGGTESAVTPIYSMILRSECLLKVLYLEICFAPGELQSVLKLTPLVTNLTIPSLPVQDISALTFDGHTPPLLPLLKECNFLNSPSVPSMETIQTFNILGSSRCDLPTSAETLLSGGFHPLQTLHISLGWQSTRYRQYFEGWINSDMANELRKRHGRLLCMLPELVEHRIRIPSTREFDVEWENKVTGLLTNLETLNIERASDICISGIQYILYAISNRFIEGDVRFSISLIAKRILKKWEPIFREEMPYLRWHSTAFYFKYLSTTQNHALRSSPDAVKLFYYGVDSDDISKNYSYLELYVTMADSMGIIELAHSAYGLHVCNCYSNSRIPTRGS